MVPIHTHTAKNISKLSTSTTTIPPPSGWIPPRKCDCSFALFQLLLNGASFSPFCSTPFLSKDFRKKRPSILFFLLRTLHSVCFAPALFSRTPPPQILHYHPSWLSALNSRTPTSKIAPDEILPGCQTVKRAKTRLDWTGLGSLEDIVLILLSPQSRRFRPSDQLLRYRCCWCFGELLQVRSKVA